MADMDIIFFSNCSTRWGDLTPSQKDSCTGQTRLQRRIGDRYYAWPAAGELLKQWNSSGSKEYAAVLKHENERRANKLFPRRKKLIALPRLFLLSDTNSRLSATPYICIPSKDRGSIKEIQGIFEDHSHLYNFGFPIVSYHSDIQLTAASEPEYRASKTSLDANAHPIPQNYDERELPMENLGPPSEPA